MLKIALFGTSADPPTVAHRAILQWLSQHYDRVAVWASDNPFKNHQTSLQHRQAMLGLIIDEIDPASHRVRLHEELSDRRSLISVKKAREIWGSDAEYTLVIGSDLAGQIRKWYRTEQLLRKVKILIVPRPGYFLQEDDLKALQDLGGNYAIADMEVPAVSSTAYRQEEKDVLTPSVKDYIRRQQLYL